MQVVPSQVSQEIIARTLGLEFGDSNFCHYGLFHTPHSLKHESAEAMELAGAEPLSLTMAQENFNKHLLSLIENGLDSKSRILIVGSSLVQLASNCAKREIRTSLLGSDLESSSVDSLEIITVAFDKLAENGNECFDLILLEGSYCYLDQLALLSNSRRLLSDGGRLLHFGEFLDDDSRIEYSPLANLSSLHRLAERLGYELLEEYEHSEDALQSIQQFLPLLEKHKGRIADESEISIDESSAYLEHLKFAEMEFASGRRCFRTLLYRHRINGAEEYGGAQYGDIHSFEAADISELFEKSFDVVFNSDLWNWKYVKGKGTCIVARLEDNGPIVAHYGGAPREISYFGEASMAIQPCDVMVHPDIRNQYGRCSLFFKVAATFLEREIGNTVNHLLGFGFPNQKAMNISIRMGLYEKTDDFVEVVYPVPDSSAAASELTCIEFDQENIEQQNIINHLWQLMAVDSAHGIIGVRNWDYIKYRYFDHPFAKSNQYRSLLVRDAASGDARAFAVLKRHGEHQLLMDIVCGRGALLPAIRELNQLVAKEEGIQGLKLWITKSYVDSILFDGAIENELGIEIPCNSWNPGPSSQILYGAWWLTAGDMDFV